MFPSKVPPTLITTICVLFLVHVSRNNAANFTIENANTYIEQNNASVNQTYRLQYHFMPLIGWMNDPNGFVYFRNEYHLFYQYNPYNTTTGDIHWGHAKSKDLIRWEHLPVALAPDQSYDSGGVFSGSAIVKDDKLYLIYTGNTWVAQVQCVAVSEDGITFEKIKENPVLNATNLPSNADPADFRDPKVFERNGTYYIVVASRTKSNTGQILLYQSTNLIEWTFKSILLQGNSKEGNMWECPDLFELDEKDVLIMSPIGFPRSGNDYYNSHSVLVFVGKVNWTEGTLDVEYYKEIDHGTDYYATQTLLDDQGRRIAISWMNMWGRNYPTSDLRHGWVGSMTLPRQLHIKDNIFIQEPISVSNLFLKTIQYQNITVNESIEITSVRGEVARLQVLANLKQAELFQINLRNNSKDTTVVSYNNSTKEIMLDRTNSGYKIIGSENPPFTSRKVGVSLQNNKLKLDIFLDNSSVEVFVNDGVESLSSVVYPTEMPAEGILFTAKGEVVIESLNFSYISGMEKSTQLSGLILAIFVICQLYLCLVVY